MGSRTFKIFISLFFFTVFVGLFYNEIKGKEQEVLQHLKRLGLEALINWKSLLAAQFCAFIASFIRAHRWGVLLEVKGKVWVSFRSITLGNVVMLFISKGGELIRLGNQKKYTNLPYGKLLSTLITDRIFDFLPLLSLVFFATYHAGSLLEESMPGAASASFIFLTIIVISIFLSILIVLFGAKFSSKINHLEFLPQNARDRLIHFTDRFCEGFHYIRSPKIIVYMVISSFLIWMVNIGTFWFSIHFLEDLSGAVSLSDSAFLFTCACLGMIVPTPGAVSYQFLLTLALHMVFSDKSDVLLVAISLYQFLLCVWLMTLSLGAGCFLWQIWAPSKKPAAQASE